MFLSYVDDKHGDDDDVDDDDDFDYDNDGLEELEEIREWCLRKIFRRPKNVVYL